MSNGPRPQWTVFRACATGKHHLEAGEPCQDAADHQVSDGVMIGVVCDGAGSARRGGAGAEFVARHLTRRIAQSIADGDLGDPALPGNIGTLLERVADVRTALEAHAHARQHDLRDYACTLVGCISAPAGGCLFHIGDGYGIFVAAGAPAVLSRPENGEFADETYFLTDEHWRAHLRVTPLPAVTAGTLLALMSDGTAPFAVDRARNGLFGPFIDPVVSYLRSVSADAGNQALLGVLADVKTHAITTDDKSLLLAWAG